MAQTFEVPAFENRKGWGSLRRGSAYREWVGQPPADLTPERVRAIVRLRRIRAQASTAIDHFK